MSSKSIIRILDENTANKIAAGEVVERPASVIKELVENSIDAKSSKIEIEICDGGISFIRVTDDGLGMNSEDAKLAILRHATSKIRLAEDLNKINSLGFRGEALPSIASISNFTLTTRLHSDSLATYVEVRGGKLVDVREAGANVGTTITVSELFFNTPARQKFLKTPTTESGYINNIISKLALSHSEIAFRLISNNKLILSTPGTNELHDAVSSIYGYKVAAETLPINFTEDEGIMVTGYLSKPAILKSNRNWQTFIVNNRIVQSRFISKAIDSAYHSLLPKTGYPLAVINITVPIDTLDVNVHPQKNEVKFSNEQLVYRMVYKAVVNTLKETPHTPENLAAVIEPRPLEYRFKQNNNFSDSEYRAKNTVDLWQEEALPFTAAQKIIQQENSRVYVGNEVTAPTENQEFEQHSIFQPLGQVEDCYIVARGEDGLYIIDQHAAHERILYDRMSNAVGRIPAQQLLTPLFFELDGEETQLVEEHYEIFHQLGFTLEQVGPNTMRLLEVPADIPLIEVEAIIREILGVLGNLQSPTAQDLRHACLQMAACRAAIKAGEQLNMRQIRALLEELFNTDLPYTCPHGRPAIIKFGPKELAKMFKRT